MLDAIRKFQITMHSLSSPPQCQGNWGNSLTNRLKKSFDLSCLRVCIPYNRFNNLDELLNGDLPQRSGIESIHMNQWNPSKFNGKCVFGGKFQKMCLIYKVKCTLCDAIYIGNTQQTLNIRVDGCFYDVQHILKNGKTDWFSSYYEQHFKSNTSCTGIYNNMTLK